MGVTRRLAPLEVAVMKFFAIISTVVASTAAQLPYAAYPGLGYAAGGYAAAAPLAVAPVAAAAYAHPIAAAPVATAAYAAPVAVAPVAAAAVAPETTSSQFRAEDEAGNTAYGYQNINNAAEVHGTAYGNGVTGSYSFRDEAGIHTVSYIADDLGYRVTGRSRRSAQVAPIAYAGVPAVTGYAGYAGAPAREAILTRIKLNPGHAEFYRVD